ncbi:MAG: hypothetical protein JNL54_08740 [Kineosporiaceae bacterium]|nr:hypothetical protein [Kineosporiaceae bacterium]
MSVREHPTVCPYCTVGCAL